MEKKSPTRVLVAPLDWGLGHATRCVPLIKELRKQQFDVFVGASGKIAPLLQAEFPDMTIITLRDYGINYAKNGRFFLFYMILQLPKILYAAWVENRQIRKIVVDYQIDAIISDNRLGCFHNKIPSVFMTHQLKIITGFRLFDWLALKANYFFINKFQECWVPDFQDENNISGDLSHSPILPQPPLRYLGLLSRFNFRKTEPTIPLTILISGPEPQRSIFEKLIITQAEKYNLEALIIRGLPGVQQPLISSNKKLQFRNHVAANELENILLHTELIIARSGYSTIMDLIALQKKAILIPTPGQTEQEYLAAIMMSKQLFFTVTQSDFNILKNIEQAHDFEFQNLPHKDLLADAVAQWKPKLRK